MSEAEARFWPKVLKSEGCWEWQGARTASASHPYGQFWWDSRLQLAHRVSWELANGPIPDGLLVCHRCDNAPCVRPDHLFLGTYSDNACDMYSKGRRSRNIGRGRAQQCPAGHPYIGDNIIWYGPGWRRCRACKHRQDATRDRSRAARLEVE